MSFVGGLTSFAKKVERNEQAVFVRSVSDLRDSIKFGSALTGAPPIPVAQRKFDHDRHVNAARVSGKTVDHTGVPSSSSFWTKS